MKDTVVFEIDGIQYVMIPVEEPMEEVDKVWVANYCNVYTSTVTRCPWYLPDFGEGDRKTYRKCDVISWLAKPVKVRKAMYEKRRKRKA